MSGTYRYVGEDSFTHKGEELEYGDTAEVSEYTVEQFDGLFEELDSGSDSDDDSDESEAELAASDPVVEKEVPDDEEFDVDEASYQELQAKASEFDDVDGRGKKEELREAVRDALEE